MNLILLEASDFTTADTVTLVGRRLQHVLAVHRARQRLGKLLRSAVAETAVPAEVEDEVRHLLAVLIETRA